jgi:hypothetical protein
MESIAVKKIQSPEPKISRDRNRRRQDNNVSIHSTPIANNRNSIHFGNSTPRSNSQRSTRPRIVTDTNELSFFSPRADMDTDEFTEVSVLDPDL